jgi:hypothetical protein
MQPASDPDSTFPQNPIPQMFRAIASRESDDGGENESATIRFQSCIKEIKTPGGEQYLDPPGVELLAWL